MKKDFKGPRKFHLKGPGASDEGKARAIAKQREWSYAVADDIERGILPDSKDGRHWIAAMVRFVADQMHAPTPTKKAGNPTFKRKIPADDTAALMVAMSIAAGDPDAIGSVADIFDASESTVSKIVADRGAAVARFLGGRRVIALGKKRRNSG